MAESKEQEADKTAQDAAEQARLAREAANKKKLSEERGSAPGPKAPGSAGQGPDGKKMNGVDQALADAASKAIFVELGKEGTMMITKPGEYNGVYQPPIVMVSQNGMSRIDKNNIIKSQWMRFSMLASTRIFNALKENAEYINKFAQEELEAITGLPKIG